MNALNILTELWGFSFLAIGLSLLINHKIEKELLKSVKSDLVLFYLGFLVFILGIASLLSYNSWSAGWSLIITIIGWLCLVKGAFLLFLPSLAKKMYVKITGKNIMLFSYFIAALLGFLLIFMGFFVS